jgi:hypothetical protein
MSAAGRGTRLQDNMATPRTTTTSQYDVQATLVQGHTFTISSRYNLKQGSSVSRLYRLMT